MPNKTTRPFPISPTISPSIVTLARVTRCTTARISSLRRTAGSDLNAARQRAIGKCEQIHHHFRDISRLKLPALFVTRFVTTKLRVHGTGHNVAHLDPVVPDFLHERFAETVQAKLGSVVSGHLRVRIGASQRRNVNDATAASLLHQWNGFVTAIENAKQVRFEYGAKLFGAHRLYRR